jgi:Tfp pilus assembly protein PilP
MAMTLMPVGTWKLGVVTAAMLVLAAATARGQVPNPTPALNAARDARTKTEAAQQKNAEALTPEQKPEQKPVAPATPATPADKNAPPPAPGAGYSYDPSGRRDPFVSLTARGGDVPVAAGMRPGGVPGLLVGEVTVKGIFKSPKGGFLALLQAPDGRTYSVKQGDKVFDGSVKVITQDTVVFSQDVNDPLSLVKQREVRKSIRPEAR